MRILKRIRPVFIKIKGCCQSASSSFKGFSVSKSKAKSLHIFGKQHYLRLAKQKGFYLVQDDPNKRNITSK